MANRNAAAAAAATAKDDDDDASTVDPKAIDIELAGGARVVLPSSPPSTVVVDHLSKEGEEDEDDDTDTDDSLSLLPTRATRSKKKQAPKKPASKKKPASIKKQAPKKPASKKKEPPLMCCAGDLCQCGGTIFGSNGHPCVICKERMHGGPCSNGMVEDPNGMTCKKCAKSQTGRKSRQTRRTAPSTTPLATQTNTRERREQKGKAIAVTKRPPITRSSRRNKKK